MLKEQFMKMSTFRKRAFAVALSAAVVSTSFNVGSYVVEAGSSAEGRVITAFEELPEDVAYQYLPVGSSQSDIDFPKELKITLYSEKVTEEEEEERKEETKPEEGGTEEVNTPEEPAPEAETEPQSAPQQEEQPKTQEEEQAPEAQPEEGGEAGGEGGEESTPAPAAEEPASTEEGGTTEGGETQENAPAVEGTEPAGSETPAETEDLGDSKVTGISGVANAIIDGFKPVKVYAAEGGEEQEDTGNDGEGGNDGNDAESGNDGKSGTDTGAGAGSEGGSTGGTDTEGGETGTETQIGETGSDTGAESGEGTETKTETEEEVKKLADGEPRVLKDVDWRLVRDESAYNRFQAVLAGDVFVYEPDIDEYGLKSDVPLPQIRVTITEKDGTVSEDTVSEDTVSEDAVSENVAFSQMMVVGGVRVTVEAPEGVFPEGAILRVKKIEGSDAEKAEDYIKSDMGVEDKDDEDEDEGSNNGGGLNILAFDVTITDAEGNELQPNTEYGEAKVTFANVGLVEEYLDSKEEAGVSAGAGDEGNEPEFKVYHFDADMENAESLAPEIDGGEKAATVMMTHFSPVFLAAANGAGYSESDDYGDYHLDLSGAKFNVGVDDGNDKKVVVSINKLAESGEATVKVSMKSGGKNPSDHRLVISDGGVEVKTIVKLDKVNIKANVNIDSNQYTELKGVLTLDLTDGVLCIGKGTSKIENTCNDNNHCRDICLKKGGRFTIEAESVKEQKECILKLVKSELRGATIDSDGTDHTKDGSDLTIKSGYLDLDNGIEHMKNLTVDGGFINCPKSNKYLGTDETTKFEINGGTHALNEDLILTGFNNTTLLDNITINGGSVKPTNDDGTVYNVTDISTTYSIYAIKYSEGAGKKLTGVYGNHNYSDTKSPEYIYGVKRNYKTEDTYFDGDGNIYLWLRKDDIPGGTSQLPDPYNVTIEGDKRLVVNEHYNDRYYNLHFKRCDNTTGLYVNELVEYNPIKNIDFDTSKLVVGERNSISENCTFYPQGVGEYSTRFRDIRWTLCDENKTPMNYVNIDNCYIDNIKTQGTSYTKQNWAGGTTESNGTNDSYIVVKTPGIYWLHAELNDGLDVDFGNDKYFKIVNLRGVEDIYGYFNGNKTSSFDLQPTQTKYSIITNDGPSGELCFKVYPDDATANKNISYSFSGKGKTGTLGIPKDFVGVKGQTQWDIEFHYPGTYEITTTVSGGSVTGEDFTKPFTVKVQDHGEKMTVDDWEYNGGSIQDLSGKFHRAADPSNPNYKCDFIDISGMMDTGSDGDYILPEKIKAGDLSTLDLSSPTYMYGNNLKDIKASDSANRKLPAGVYIADGYVASGGQKWCYAVFQVKKVDAGKDVIVAEANENVIYNGVSQNLIKTLEIKGGVTEVNKDDIRYTVNDGSVSKLPVLYETDAGTYKYKFTLDGSKNYKGAKELEVKIKPREITDNNVTVTKDDSKCYYTGSPVTLTTGDTLKVQYKNGNNQVVDLEEGTDFIAEYKNNTNIGTATVTLKGIGNFTGSRNVNFTIKQASLSPVIKYDGSTTINDWYPGEVSVSADGFTVSDKPEGPYNDTYTLSGNGKNVTKELYFKCTTDGDKKGAIVKKTAGPVNLNAPSVTIKVMGHSYSKFQGKEEIDDYTNETKEIKITPTADVKYYISDKFYSSYAELKKEMEATKTVKKKDKDGNEITTTTQEKWSDYNDKSRPYLVKNKLNYIYAKVEKGSSEVVVSSKGIWEDELKPKVNSGKTTPKDTSTSLEVKATDDESGLKYYYVLIKKKDESKPSKAEDVKSSGKKNEDGKFTLEGLTANTDYVAYVVVEDKAENLSEIKEVKVKTKAKSSSSSSGTGGAGGANSAGAGAAGGGSNAAKHGVGGDGGKGASGNGAGGEGEDEEVIKNKIPYIEDATEGIMTGKEYTSGWSKIENETLAAAAPAEITIDMNGGSVVPAAALNNISGRDITVYLDMGDGIIWAVNGLSFADKAGSDIDFKVKKNTKNIPSKILNEIADVYPHTNLTLAHDGEFGFTAILSLDLGKDNSGMYGNLYHYNEDEGSLEFVEASEISGGGNAQFEFTHASDYTVIVRGDALTEKTAAALQDKYLDSGSGDSDIVSGAANVSKKTNHIWLLIVTIISILLCGFILFMPDKKRVG